MSPLNYPPSNDERAENSPAETVAAAQADSHSLLPGGNEFWRSLDTRSFRSGTTESNPLHVDAQTRPDKWGLNRRQFTRLMAASMALAGAGINGCRRWPEQTVRPQTERTEGFLPGVPEYFATQFELGGISTGILAKSLDGRPIKIEGNDLHPFSKGSAGVFAQASVLELYDPDRTKGYIYRPQNAPEKSSEQERNDTPAQHPRESFQKVVAGEFAALQSKAGRGLHILTQADSSPTLQRMRAEFQAKFPESRWYVYQPLDRDNEFEGSKLAFGKPLRPQFNLEEAETIVCLDADLLGSHPGQQKWCRDWAAIRNPDSGSYGRLWSFESGYSITGAAADIRVPLTSSKISALVRAIAFGLGLLSEPVSLESHLQDHVRNLVEELKHAAGKSLLVAGPAQIPIVHAMVHAINQHLNSEGVTVWFSEEPSAENKTCVDSLADLVAALRGKSVETLLIMGGNPLYDAPADLQLDLKDQPRLTSVYLGLFDNETAQQCTWHAPEAHQLEAWGDGRGWDGTYGIRQPLIYPLFDGISKIEMLSLAMGQPVENGLNLVRETSKGLGVDDDRKWNRLLHDGLLKDSRFADVKPTLTNVFAPGNANVSESASSSDGQDGFEIHFVPDGSTWDGRFANNGWLQELPDAITKLTWDNAALVSKQDADQHSLKNGDVISIEHGDFKLEGIPVLIQPGQAKGTISLALGYGRSFGHIAKDVGSNVFAIRTSDSRYVVDRANIQRTGRNHQLASTQDHFLLDAVGQSGYQQRVGEPAKSGLIVRETTLQQHRQDPDAVHAGVHHPLAAPLFDQPDKFNSPSSWGMSIDLNKCVGCNACVVACQSENNVPIVGKANVIQNREMHWLRIDRYFKGDVDEPDVVHVPMACAHCEDAPCEQVCPVAATVHDTEGLNAMVYNRCVGTRYCANNCPYKVRRFNYFDYHASNPRTPPQPWLKIPDQQQVQDVSELEQMVFNPQVSVRMRGVMEKCTYCVQRISAARIQARNEHAQGKRSDPGLTEGEVVTACQQACPTQAIRFGDLNDENSDVSQAHQDSRAYSMLEETNIKPRTRYLARIRHVDSDDPSEEAHHGHS